MDDVIDLRDPRPIEEPTPQEVIDWLRSHGGTLHDRLMSARAADLIERVQCPT